MTNSPRSAWTASRTKAPLRRTRPRCRLSAYGSSRRKTTSSSASPRAGLLAPEGDVDHILQTVVNNLEVTNNIDLPRPVRTRVLLTSPLETFSVGNTIVISRGLVDVLPDEASLAAVLSHELAHIVLGHNLGSKYAFNDRMLFSDDSTYQNLGFKHIPEEEAGSRQEGDRTPQELALRAETRQRRPVPEALQLRAPQLSALLTTHLGNPLAENGTVDSFVRLCLRKARRSTTRNSIRSRLFLWAAA